MPVYEYECVVCEKRFELQRHFGDSHPTTCPAGHEGLQRVFVSPTIIFKGSGFYTTDHKRNGRYIKNQDSDDKTPKPDESEKPKAETKEGVQAKTETKPVAQAKTETKKGAQE